MGFKRNNFSNGSVDLTPMLDILRDELSLEEIINYFGEDDILREIGEEKCAKYHGTSLLDQFKESDIKDHCETNYEWVKE